MRNELADIEGKVVYLSGPMSGYPEYNFPAFKSARERLRSLGLTVVCPAEAGQVDGWGWEDYLRRDLALLLDGCEAVVVLRGWEKSRGARLEVSVAWQLNMPVAEYEDL